MDHQEAGGGPQGVRAGPPLLMILLSSFRSRAHPIRHRAGAAILFPNSLMTRVGSRYAIARFPNAAAQTGRLWFEHWVQKDQARLFLYNTTARILARCRYQAKWCLNREAAVLTALHSGEQKDARCSQFVEKYQPLIYPSDKQNRRSHCKANPIKSATLETSGNSTEESRRKSLGENWFADLVP